MIDPRSDAAISRDVAQDAGQLLLRIRQDFIAEHGPIGDKETANMLRDRADAAPTRPARRSFRPSSPTTPWTASGGAAAAWRAAVALFVRPYGGAKPIFRQAYWHTSTQPIAGSTLRD